MSIIYKDKYEIEILHEDQDYIFLNKPSGLLVHPYPTETNEKLNLLKIVRDHCGHYLYPIHRLDRPVSGVIVFGKSADSAAKLKKIWHESVQKKYLALVRGHPDQSGIIDFPLNNEKKIAQEARTAFKVVQYFEKSALLEVEIFTGRKHQIRRHFSRRMHHVICDTRYGKGRINHYYRDHFGIDRIFLHAASLSISKSEWNLDLCVESQLPENLSCALQNMNPFQLTD